jgi:hypothetical protein
MRLGKPRVDDMLYLDLQPRQPLGLEVKLSTSLPCCTALITSNYKLPLFKSLSCHIKVNHWSVE